jgi:hypothetical protein
LPLHSRRWLPRCCPSEVSGDGSACSCCRLWRPAIGVWPEVSRDDEAIAV